MKLQKVVFKDAGRIKTAIGRVIFEEGFVKVTDKQGNSIYINKEHIIFIRDGDYR